jgi:UDP-N-acetyl-D-mannosaminuronic acid dehydrogenase
VPNPASVCVLGLGYIGLPTAATIAAAGHRVHGVDTNPLVVETIGAGQVHIEEPRLPDLVASVVASGQLTAAAAAGPADVFLICVPTPLSRDSAIPTPDTSHVMSAARSIAEVVAEGNLVVIESTCPVGTTELVRDVLAASGVDTTRIRIAYCPERVLPGRILDELTSNDRIIGGIDPGSSAAAEAFYRTFVSGALFTTDSRTAEMVKLVENSFRDVNIAFANEVSMLSDHLGLDPWEVIRLANRHPRVSVLQPGPGVGGHCIAVDPWFIVSQDPETARLLRAGREVNDRKTDWVIDRVQAAAAEESSRLGRPARVACMGLAYKANVDDLRESPALRVALSLGSAGVDVLACEPHIRSHPALQLHDVDAAISGADIIALLVNHAEFAGLDLEGKVVLDFCGATASRSAS